MTAPVITLRIATDADTGALDRLLSQSYTKLLKSSYPPSVQVLALPIISRANPTLLSSGTYYVAEDGDGNILGAGGWTRSIKGPAIADIRHVVTHHRHLRRGIARLVMMGVFSEARVAGITRLDCLATRTAVPFYEAMGFDVEANVTVGLRPGIDFPAIRMVRVL
ncbi:MAG: GNAT family N-acetyltransferase [Pseudomonadota bacterium]